MDAYERELVIQRDDLGIVTIDGPTHRLQIVPYLSRKKILRYKKCEATGTYTFEADFPLSALSQQLEVVFRK